MIEHIYSVTPLLEDHFEERLADVIDQYKRQVADCPLFMMYLQPEGNPVWDKATDACRRYARYRRELEKQGIPSAILIQSTFGHGNAAAHPAPFQRMIGLADGKEHPVYCPMDPDTIKYLSESIEKIAKEHPRAIMLDDDVRLLMRPFEGCACPRHMAEFNRINRTNMTREELVAHIKTHPKNDPLTRSYEMLQRQTLVNAVTAFRAAIDSVDPSIQGINCTSGDECDSVVMTNPIFAGKDNPTIVRAPNGTYAPLTTRGFSDTMRRAAVCGSRLRKNGIDIVLAETDTVPFNRYAKNARYLHAHFAASVLDGLKGAKHWITRTTGYEPKSGVEFRNILAKHRGFYEELARLSDSIKFVGANSAFIEEREHPFFLNNPWRYHSNDFAGSVLERLGIPFYFSDECEPASFLEDNIVEDMTDEEIKEFFKGSVFCSAQAANDLIKRGYGDLLGIKVREYEGSIVNGESFDGTDEKICTKQKNFKELVIESEKVEALSYCFRRDSDGIKLLFPAVTLYEREGGLISVVFSGTPTTAFKYTEAFSFLNESRKAQIVAMLKRAKALPVYCASDNELCLRAGYLSDGSLLTALFNIGFDPEEKITYYLEKEPKSASILMPDGSYTDVPFTALGDNLYQFDAKAEPMYPVVIIIKQ